MDELIKPLELRENNPYSTGYIVNLPNDTPSLEREPLVYTKSNRDRYYTTIQDETLWQIANAAYKDSKLWWIIADVNQIDMPFELEPGTSLLIPDLNTIKANL